MKTQSIAIVAIVVIRVSGCVSKESIVSSMPASEIVGEGVIYSLPKQLVKVSYSRSLLESNKTSENLQAAKDGVEADADKTERSGIFVALSSAREQQDRLFTARQVFVLRREEIKKFRSRTLKMVEVVAICF